MRISVVRSGGFAGIDRHGEADTAADPILRALVARVDLGAVRAARGPVPDQFVYAIDIGDRSVSVGDSQLTGALRELVHHVLRG